MKNSQIFIVKCALLIFMQCFAWNLSAASESLFRRIDTADFKFTRKPERILLAPVWLILEFGQPSKNPNNIDSLGIYYFIGEDNKLFAVSTSESDNKYLDSRISFWSRESITGFDFFAEDGADIGKFSGWFTNRALTLRNGIVGKWVYTHKDSQCEEILKFEADGTYYEVSSQEFISGKYKNEPAGGVPDRQKVTFYDTHGNGLMDCTKKTNIADSAFFMFLEIQEKKMYVYETPKSASSIIELERKQ